MIIINQLCGKDDLKLLQEIIIVKIMCSSIIK